MAADYGSANYWDERYSADDDKQYDWYQDYSSLEPYLAPYLKRIPDYEILIPGCGSSKLGASLYDNGYVNVTNIDVSTVVINQMDSAYSEKEEMEFSVMDAKRLEFIPDQCFDLVIDKALMDTMLCSETNFEDCQQYLLEMYRILKVGSAFVIISHAAPERRLPHITGTLGEIDVEVVRITKPAVKDLQEETEAQKYHYMYVVIKAEAGGDAESVQAN